MTRDPGILERAHARAQRRLRTMVEVRAYPDPAAPETRLYVESERLVDALLTELRWETHKAEWAELVAVEDAESADAGYAALGYHGFQAVGPR